MHSIIQKDERLEESGIEKNGKNGSGNEEVSEIQWKKQSLLWEWGKGLATVEE